MVERDLAKVEVAGSSPVIRSIIILGAGQIAQTVKGKAPPESVDAFHFFLVNILYGAKAIWHHSQVVRQRSAKPLRPGSNPGGASRKKRASQRLALFFQLNPSLRTG